MTDEQLVADLVQSFSRQLRPGDRDCAARATATAMRALVQGASVVEAYAEGRRFVRSWSRHPAHRPVERARLDLAS